jgi:glycosyltransferase involved in cell wall biosynthesis
LNILHISPSQGAFGGIEAFVLALADELHRSGENIRVIFKKVDGYSEKNSLVLAVQEKKYQVEFIGRRDIASIAQAIQWAHIVHGHNPLLEAVFGSIWFRKPCVLTVYNWCRKNFHPRPLLWRLANYLAVHRWYISDFVWSSWETQRRNSSGKLPIVSDLPKIITPSHKRKGFIFASRWIPNKGLRTLLRAYIACDFDKQAWPLTILGDGSLRDEIHSIVRESGTEGIVLEGFLPVRERNKRISRAKWMVTPPNTNEDLGLTVIEARNVKVPCIITRDGGLPEAAGINSLVCEPGDITTLSLMLSKAAELPEEDYIKLCELTWQELCAYLKPLSVYRRAYWDVLKNH